MYKYLPVLLSIVISGCSSNEEEEQKASLDTPKNPTVSKTLISKTWELDLCYQAKDLSSNWYKSIETFDDTHIESKLIEYSDSKCTMATNEYVQYKLPYTLGKEVVTEDGLKATQYTASGELKKGPVTVRSIISIKDECLYFGENKYNLTVYPTALFYDACYK